MIGRKTRYAAGGVAALLLLAGLFDYALTFPGVQRRIVETVAARSFAAAKARRAFVDEPGMKVLLCGTSSPLPNRERAGPCAAIIAQGKIWLVDVGGGSWKNMSLWQMPADRVGGVFLTHFHSDHIADLGEVNMQSWGLGRPDKLPVYGGPGVDTVVDGFLQAYSQDGGYRTAHHGAELMVPDHFAMLPVTIAEPGGEALKEGETELVFEQDGLKVTAIGVNHFPVVPAYGYRFDYAGRSVVISGDTKYSPKLAEAAKGADVIVHEAQAQEMVKLLAAEVRETGNTRLAHIFNDIQSYHTSTIEAAQIGNLAGAKLVVFTHLTPPMPRWLADRVFMAGVEAVRPSGTLVGHDGLIVTLPPDSTAVEVGSLD